MAPRTPDRNPRGSETTPLESRPSYPLEPVTPTPHSCSIFDEAQMQFPRLSLSSTNLGPLYVTGGEYWDDHVDYAATTTLGHVEQSQTPAPTDISNNNVAAEGAQPQTTRSGHSNGSIYTTPANKGTSSASHSRLGATTVPELREFIAEDIKMPDNRIRVHFLDYLKFALKSCALDSDKDDTDLLHDVVRITTQLCNSDDFKEAKKHLNDYCAPKKTERDGYPALSKCLNELLRQLVNIPFPMLKESTLPAYTFHLNDPFTLVHQYAAENVKTIRKPDFLLLVETLLKAKQDEFKVALNNLELRLNALEQQRDVLVDSNRKELNQLRKEVEKTQHLIDRKPPPALSWNDVLTTLEIKLASTAEFPHPPETYDGSAPVDYHVLDDGDLVKGDACASVRYQVRDNNDPLQEADHAALAPSHKATSDVYTSFRLPSTSSRPPSTSFRPPSTSSQPPSTSSQPPSTSSRPYKKSKTSSSKPRASSNLASSAPGEGLAFSDAEPNNITAEDNGVDDLPDGILTLHEILAYHANAEALVEKISKKSDAINHPSSGTAGSKRRRDDEPYSISLIPKRHAIPKLPYLTPNEQNSMYGCEMLCRGTYSLHSINLLIVDDLTSLWWYDRQNAIQTTQLNFVKDMPYFLALLIAFQRFNLSEWGIEQSLAPPLIFREDVKPRKGRHVNMAEITFDNGIRATVVYGSRLPLYGPVLKGRATSVLAAMSKSTRVIGENLVIKASWPEESRFNEAEIIQRAEEALVWSNQSDMVNHLPKLFASIDIASSSTGRILEVFKSRITDNKVMEETRILRIHLFRQLTPMDTISDEDIFKTAWLHCFKCHRALWNRRVVHGDISVYNLMWDEKYKRGILNDFDLAVIKDGMPVDDFEWKNKRGGERTGTLPFMARNLHNENFGAGKEEREYRHELESFIWVFIWVCIRGCRLEREEEWRVGTNSIIQKAKLLFIYRLEDEKTQIYPAPVFSDSWEKAKLLVYLLSRIDSTLRDREALDDGLIHSAALDIICNDLTRVQVRRLPLTTVNQV